MNLFENLQIYKEFADKRKDIKNSLRNSEKQRRENLIQLFLWRDTTTVGHWCDELYAACSEINLSKSDKKYPKVKFILQEIWYCWEDGYNDKINKWIRDVERKENNKASIFSKDNLYNFMKDYHIWLSENLSINGFVELPDVEEKIKELLNKYPIN